MSKVIDKVYDRVSNLLKEMDVELVEITYKKVMQDMHLTLFIDTEEGVTLDDCERVHRAVDALLDELDPTDGEPYVLNVSSPGLDRPLKIEWDFKKNKGKEINVSLFDKCELGKKFVATLDDYDLEKGIVVLSADGKTAELEIKSIALMKPEIKF